MVSAFVGLMTMVVGLVIGIGIGFLMRPMLDSYLRWRMATDEEAPSDRRLVPKQHETPRI